MRHLTYQASSSVPEAFFRGAKDDQPILESEHVVYVAVRSANGHVNHVAERAATQKNIDFESYTWTQSAHRRWCLTTVSLIGVLVLCSVCQNHKTRRMRTALSAARKWCAKRLPATRGHPTLGLDAARLEDRVLFDAVPMLDGLLPQADAIVEVDPTLFDAAPDILDLTVAAFGRIPAPPDFEHESAAVSETSDSSSTASFPEAETRLGNAVELVIVDSSVDVDGYQALVEDLELSRADGVVLDILLLGPADGLEEITERLGQWTELDAMHIVSHGNGQGFQLGSDWLDLDSLSQNASLIEVWGQSLSADADLLIYGCDLASSDAGLDLLNQLGLLCDCDVAASADTTGNQALGGDWDLEYKQGEIQTEIVFSQTVQHHWSGVLAAVTVDTFSDKNDGDTTSIASLIASPGGSGISLREAIIAANNSSTGDQINLGAGTFTLGLSGIGEQAAATGDLDIIEDLTITGAGAAATIVNANGIDRVFDVHSGTTVLQQLTVTGGTNQEGAGLFVKSGATLSMTNGTIEGNTSNQTGAGIHNDGTVSLFDVRLVNNSAPGKDGGAIHNDGSLTLERVTISGNTAAKGAGIFHHNLPTLLSLTNATISGNTATDEGGGIHTDRPVDITNSTIAFNTANSNAAGIFANGAITLANTILYENRLSDSTPANVDPRIAINSIGFNIDSDGTAALSGPGDLSGVDPMLPALQNNGGAVETHALPFGSVAINAGGILAAPTVDARGVARDSLPDIGAYEALSSAGKLFWADETDDEIVRANTDGSAVQTIVTGLVRPRGVAVDSAGGKVYWTDNSQLKVQRANLDGSDVQDLLTSSDGLTGPHHIAIDSVNAKFYFADDAFIGGAVKSADLDGSNLMTVTVAADPEGIAVDPAGGKVYWTDTFADAVARSNFDGSNPEVRFGESDPEELALDLVAGHVYWANDGSSNRIRRANLDFSSPTDILTGASNVEGIVLDVAAAKMYFTIGNKINQANLDGTGETTILNPLAGPAGIDLAGFIPVTTLIVDTTSDVVDGDTSTNNTLATDKGPDGLISLREAMIAANNTPNLGGPDKIHFSISGPGPHSIQLGSVLPAISDAVIIDATTEPDHVNSPIIELDGSATLSDGLVVTSTGRTTIRGLVINRFPGDGIELVTGGHLVEGNYIGTDVTGTLDRGNGAIGISIESGNNTIGGLTDSARNVISGNGRDGIRISGATATANVVQGNYVGVNDSGSGRLGNTDYGIRIEDGAALNVIGGIAAGARNVISANNRDGILIVDAGSSANLVQGNYIGTDALGASDLGNRFDGVRIAGGAAANTIAGTTAAARNIISANRVGIVISDSGTDANTVQGNYIGTGVSGTTQLGNAIDGIAIQNSADNNLIGGTASGARNVISANFSVGVRIEGAGTSDNRLEGNFIGVSATGIADLGNLQDGVLITNAASSTTIGGTTAAARNIISGNDGNGIRVESDDNTIYNNYIGLGSDGVAALGNSGVGVAIRTSVDRTTVGSLTAPNTIGYNADDGVELSFDAGRRNEIRGNSIFSNGDAVGPNQELGIDLSDNNVSPNDVGDGDVGPNDLQNYPVISSANIAGSNVTITGTLNSASSTIFDLDFYANDTGDPSGHGEGQTYLGSTTVTTNSSGDANINVTLAATVSVGAAVSATATDPQGNTSEFSANVSAAVANVPPVAVDDSYLIDEDTTLVTTAELEWFDSGWTARRQITMDNAAQTENLIDFPVLVTLSTANIDYTKTQNDGADLRFVDADGMLLAYEIEEWNETGTSTVWVKVPQIDGLSNTDYIWMYYGNDSAIAGENTAAVWTNGYQTVQHIHDDFLDSTANANDATNSGSTNVDGQIADAQLFDGTDDFIDLGGDASLQDIFATGGTVSAWIKPSNWGEAGFGRILDKAPATHLSTDGWALQLDVGQQGLLFEHGFSGNEGDWRSAASGSIQLNTWQLVTLSFDASSTSNDPAIYVDGVSQSLNETQTPSGSSGTDAGIDLRIGNHSTVRTFDGVLDEIRVSNVARSADWVAAQYLSTTGGLLTFSPEAAGPGGVLTNDTDAEMNPLTAILDMGPSSAQSFNLMTDGSFTYTPVQDFEGFDSFTYKAHDGTDTSNAATVTITVNGVNDPPTLTSFSSTVESTIEGVEVEITLVELKAEGNEADVDGTVDAFDVNSVSNGTLNIGTNSGSAAPWDPVLNNTVTSSLKAYWTPNLGATGSRDAFAVVAEDNLGAHSTPDVSVQVQVIPANVPPVLDGIEGSSLVYTENDGLVPVTSTVSVSDIDDTHIENATIAIVSGYMNGEGRLAFTNTANIMGSFDTNTGTLSLTGNDLVANYEAALRSVSYENTSEDPSTVTRTVNFTVNDGEVNSNTVTRTITVIAQNDPPVVDLNGADAGFDFMNNFREGDPGAAISDAAATVSDVDSTNLQQLVVTLTNRPDGDLVEGLTVGPTTLSAVYNPATGILNLSGGTSIGEYETALRTVQYTNSSQDPSTAPRIVTVVALDDAGLPSSAAVTTITVDSVNDPPAITAPTAQSVDEDGILSFTGPAGILVADPDSGSDSIEVTVTATNGDVILGSTSGITITGGSNMSPSVTFTAPLATANAALNNTQYDSTADYFGTAMVDISVNDQGHNGTGGPQSDTAAVAITINPVNDAPLLNVAVEYSLDAISDGELDPAGNTVAELLDSVISPPISDIDTPISSVGMALTSENSSSGTWQFSTNGGANWTSFSGTSESNALLLDPSAKIRFIPQLGKNGTSGLTFRAWDQTQGSLGTFFNIVASGGSSAFSSANGQATILVDDDPQPPALTPESYAVNANQLLQINKPGLLANDFDPDFPAPPAMTAGETLNFDATLDTDGDNQWQNEASTAGFDWSLASVTRSVNPDSLRPRIGVAYSFNGSGGTTSSFEGLAGDLTDAAASFEIWFRPTNDSDHDILFETGGSTDGTSLSVDGTTVKFNILDGGSGGSSTELSALIDPTEFSQVVGVIVPGTGDTKLYVNGNLADSDTNGGLDDWAGPDDSGLGKANGSVNFAGGTSFEGKIALFRLYERALTMGQIQTNFDAVATGLKILGATPTAGFQGNLTVLADGSLSYDPDGAFISLDAGQMQDVSFNYLVQDGSGLTATALASVTVHGVNDPPVGQRDVYSIETGGVLVVSAASSGVLANDTDPENHGTTAVLVQGPTNGTIVLQGDGTFTYTPDLGFVGADQISYQVSDGTNLSAPVVVDISVMAVSGPPGGGGGGGSGGGGGEGGGESGGGGEGGEGGEGSGEGGEGGEEGEGGEGSGNDDRPLSNDPNLSPIERIESPPIGSLPGQQEDEFGFATEDSSSTQIVGIKRAAAPIANRIVDRISHIPSVEESALAPLEILVDAVIDKELMFVVQEGEFWDDLDSIEELAQLEVQVQASEIASALGLTTTVSVGYVLWALRGGYLLSFVLAQMPAWRMIDPLPIFDSQSDEDEDDETLASMIDQSNAKPEAAAAPANPQDPHEPHSSDEPPGDPAAATGELPLNDP